MRLLMRLALPVLLVFALVMALESRPGPSERVLPPDTPEGVVRTDGRVWIDLNRADAELLTSIPGVGPVLAGRIRARIDEKGALTAPEELLDIEGIGPAKLRAIQESAVIIP